LKPKEGCTSTSLLHYEEALQITINIKSTRGDVMSYESFAKDLIDLHLGLHVVPYGQRGHPNVTNYQKREVAIGTLEDFDRHFNYNWRYGLGLVLPLSNIVMVDLDMHDSERENGLLSWERICQHYGENGTAPETWMYKTPRGGRHLLYRRPDDFPADFSTGFFAPGAELKFNTATPLPPNQKWKKIGEDRAGKPLYEKTPLRYQWMTNDAEDFEDWVFYRPGEIPLADLPEWLTAWARCPKVPMLSDGEYKAMTGHTPPIVRTKGASVYERFLEKHGREPERVQELWDFHKYDIGALAIVDGLRKSEARKERYRLTGSTRTTPEYSQAQVEDIIADHNLAVIGKPEQNGRSLITWRLSECPLERDRKEERTDGHKKGSEGNVTISYDPETRTPMFYCFEGKCKELVEHEFDGNWWAALLASLGVEELPLIPSAPTMKTITARKKTKKRKQDYRKDERNFPVPDCQDGLTPPWESHNEEERTTRLAALDAHLEEEYQEHKHRKVGEDATDEAQRKWEKTCYLARHLPTCYFCDVPVDILQAHLDRRFPISPEEREVERKRIEGFYNYYLQTTKEM
jgi:hypothetical protein